MFTNINTHKKTSSDNFLKSNQNELSETLITSLTFKHPVCNTAWVFVCSDLASVQHFWSLNVSAILD